MNPKNAEELLSKPDVDGGLIGGASLKADQFAVIVEAATKGWKIPLGIGYRKGLSGRLRRLPSKAKCGTKWDYYLCAPMRTACSYLPPIVTLKNKGVYKSMSKKPVMLCIMDGFGWTPDETYGNAVAAANKPNLDKIFANYPMTTIQASGMAVGLPDGQMGNSEVGHTNMGAGRIVYQQLTLITKSIKDGEMFKNPVLVKNMKAAIDAGKAIHLMGLVGTGGVHSHADHWFGVLEMAKHMGAKDVYLHCIMDGRDTDPHSGKGFLADLQAKLDELGIGTIASVSGRYYAMDRDNNWDREEKAYAAFVYGEGNHAANAQEAIEATYAADGKTNSSSPLLPVRVAAWRMAIPSSS